MAHSGYIPISYWQLTLSVILVLITGLISALLGLGMIKSLLWGTLRAFIQLTLIGYILTYIFKLDTLLVIIPLVLLQCYIASREATRRITKAPHNPALASFFSLTASTFIVGIIVVVVIIGPHPWYKAQILIPIFGMIMGNSMNAIALSLDRLYSEVHAHVEQVEQMLAFGASPWEAIVEYLRKAVGAGMLPTINALMIVGIVSLPGMMTGQILAGMSPGLAVRYQFVVMIMMTSATAIGCLVIVGLSYQRMFTSDGALVDSLRKNQ